MVRHFHILILVALACLWSAASSLACPAGETCITVEAASTAGASGLTGALNVKDPAFGAICDGSAHALSTRYGSLGAAQAVYPFVTSLTQQIDYAALKLASNTAFGADGSEHGSSNPQLNVPIYIPQGICYLGSDTWHIAKLSGGSIRGAAKTASQIKGDSIVLQFDGLWYSQISDLSIATTSSSAIVALDVDGNAAGPGTTFGVQGNLFENLIIGGGGSNYTFAMCRVGGGGGQCSEQTYINIHLSNASFAAYYQNGFNAIANQFIGGDMQNFTTYAVYLLAGSLNIYGTSFESGAGYTQLANGGCDINANSASASDVVGVYGTRSESLCMYNGGAQKADIRGMHQAEVIGAWTAGAKTLNTLARGIDAAGVPRAFRVTTAGSGGTQPVWPASGTVSETGGVVWTYMPYISVNVGVLGFVDIETLLVMDTSTVITTSYQNVASCGTGQGGVFGSDTSDVSSSGRRGSVTEGNPSTGCTVHLRLPEFMTASHIDLVTRPPLPAAPKCLVTSPTGTVLTGYSVTYNPGGGGLGEYWYLAWTHASTTTPAPKFVWSCSQP